MAPIVFNWRHLALCVTLTSVSSNTFIDDLVRLSQIKKELQNSFLTTNFF
ncbi:hypothetical protein SAMN05216324_10479 [Chryseobacterium limigenitum]|uniref:Uncharacterized protein n=1 Tax=Chryseobacterium limigenitum TaxID=1612149 RepID=A0A1K2IMU6_9FLAO|nr:hypothetical protein SAMN05216324_10479 [Chryseobacterium limigenitum]